MTVNNELWYHLGLKNEIGWWDLPKIVVILLYVNLIIGYIVIFNIFNYVIRPPMIALMPLAETKWRFKLEMGFWNLCVFLLERAHWEIQIRGDQLELENALFISNHCGLIDYLVFGYLVQCLKYPPSGDNGNNNNMVFSKSLTDLFTPHLSFFTWFTVWSIPTVEYIKNIFQSDENWELDGETLSFSFDRYIASNIQWLVMFPEVNIFNEKIAKLQKLMGEKYFLPEFKNILYPRFGGVINAIGGLYETKFTRLYDITLVYYTRTEEGEIDFICPNLLDALGFSGKNYILIVHVKGKFMSRVPLKRNKLEKWVENRWIKKDKTIERIQNSVVKQNKSN